MFVNKVAPVALSMLICTAGAQEAYKPNASPAPTLTIGQMAEQARQKRLNDEAGKGAQPSPQQPGAPAGMVIVPSTQIISSAAAVAASASVEAKTKKKPQEKKETPPEFTPSVLAIYRKGHTKSVELMELNGNGRFETGQVTPSGWTVIVITDKSVDLGKIDPKSGVTKKITLQVSAI